MTKLAFAFLAFFKNHHRLFEADHPEGSVASFIDEEDVLVTFTARF